MFLLGETSRASVGVSVIVLRCWHVLAHIIPELSLDMGMVKRLTSLACRDFQIAVLYLRLEYSTCASTAAELAS